MGILVDSRNEKRRQEQRRTEWKIKLMADAAASEERKRQRDSSTALKMTGERTEDSRSGDVGLQKNIDIKNVSTEFHPAPQKNWFEKALESIKNSYIVQQPLRNTNNQSWENFTKETGWTSDDITQQVIRKSADGDALSVHPNYMRKAIENGAYKNDEKLTEVKEGIENIRKSWEYSPASATFANIGAAGADMGANLAGALQMLGGDKIPGVNDILDAAVNAAKKAQENAQSYNKATGDEMRGTYVQGITQMIPYIIAAFATGGASTGTEIASAGMSAVQKGITTLMKNPSFWYSFINGAGEKYRSAIDNGATRGQATTNALYAIPEAMVEVGGGFGADDVIEQSLLKTTGEEILEELTQNTIGKVGEKFSYDYNKPVFSMSEDAIINPKEMADTAVMTALLTGTTGTATKGINTALNKKTSAENSGGNVIQYTTEEADGIRKDSQTFRNVIVGTDITLGEFFNKWKFGRKKGEKLEKLYLGKASDSVKQQISDLLGYDIPNRDFIITNEAVKHIFDEHGDIQTEEGKGQVVIDEETISTLSEALNNPDSITKEFRKKEPRIVFKKKTSAGNVIAVEVDNKGRATLSLKTIYIKKGQESTQRGDFPSKTRANLLTSETTVPNSLDDVTIPHESGNVKETVISANPGFTKTEFSDKITNKQIRALDSIGRALGVNISIGAPTGEGKGAYNGYYENGNIVIAQDARNPLEVVLCHEVTHHMKNTSPAEYNTFLELAINASEKLSNAEKSELITRYKTAYSEGTQTEFSDAQALDEIAADFTKNIVNDVKMFERLAQDNRTVAMKLMDSIKDFITKVKSTFSGDKAKADTAAQEKYGARVSELEAAVAQFEKMLSVTETAVASGNINTAGTDVGGGRMYSIKGSLHSDLQDVLAYENKNDTNELLIGTTSDFLVNELGADPLQVTMPKNKAYAAMVTETEAKRAGRYDSRLNYHGLGADLLYEALTASENPVVAFVAENEIDEKTGRIIDRSDRIVLVTDKVKDGSNVVVIMQMDAQGIVDNGRLQVNKDITVYDRNSIASDISKAIADHRLLHFDKKRSQTITAGDKASNSPSAIQNVDFKDNISRFWANVNWKKSGGKSVFEAPAIDSNTAFEEAYNKSLEKSNRENSLKTADLLSPDYGKVGGRDSSTALRMTDGRENTSSTAGGPPSPQGEGTVDTYFNDLEERAHVIQDKRIAEANSALMSAPNTKKKTLREKASESVSYVKRKMVNSGDAIRKIQKATKDGYLYAAYNRARSSMNIVSDMLRNKQTNIRGQKVGESLEGIIAPIKANGDEYFRDFQLYLLHKHNVARMSLKDTRAEELARTELKFFIKENPDIAAMGEAELRNKSLWDDERGFRARQYLELREKLNRAQNTNNKPIFFDNDGMPLNADESRRTAAELFRKNSDFAKDEASVRKYLDNLMEYRVDSGLITQEEADYFKKKYPDYVPTYRDTVSVQKQMQGKTNVGTTIGRAKGGNDPIIPLDVALSEMTKKVVRSGQKNIFTNKVFDLYDAHSELLSGYITEVNEGERDIDAEIDSFGDEKAFDNTVSFHNNGKRVELTVTPELFEAFDALSKVPKEQPDAVQKWRKVNEVYKKLITTYDPTFIVRNGFKDFFDGFIQSKNAGAFLKNYGKAYSEIANGGKMWELYQAAGGLYSSRFEELQNEGVTEKTGKLAKVKEKLAFANMTVEQAPRLAEFMSVVERGDMNDPDTIADALLAAAEVTTNFGESGTLGKVLNAYYIPFLNPAIQGTAKVVRTFTESKTGKQWLGLTAKCMIMGLGAGFLNDLINGDDEDYENLPDRTKDNYLLFPIGDGKFFRLPKGRVMAALGIVADRLRDTMKGENVDAREALSRIAENILPENPLNNNIFKAWFDADLFNDESKGRTWYGTDIENESLQALPAGERFDNSTDYISKTIGKALGVSPKKLNYILQQYTGGVGRMVLPMLTPKEQKGDSVAGKIGYGLLGILTSNFTTDSKLSNKISGEFYDAVDAAEQAKNSAKGTLADKIVYKHLNRERNMVGTYSSKVRAAEVDDNLMSKERSAAVRAASAERTAYQKTILKNLDKYRSSVEKYLKKYPGKNEDKKLEYAYREANRALYGEEYAIRVNGGSDVHKKAEEKVKRGKTTWKKYYDEYFGKTERRFEAISDRFDISYTDFEKIESAISKNSSKADEIAAIQKLGYKNSIARRIYTLYHDTE